MLADLLPPQQPGIVLQRCETIGQIAGRLRQRHGIKPIGLLQLRDIAGELLAQRERCRVLQVCAADLDDLVEVL